MGRGNIFGKENMEYLTQTYTESGSLEGIHS